MSRESENSTGAGKLIVKGARTHNLKNITVEMPRNKMIVFTGLSGSGKSSLAFDTIFAEGQRRYVESLSAYARQFLRQMQKPDVDEIVGLSPAISIDQKSRSNNPRSTVATITEIYDYLRVLFARVGKPHCLICGRVITKHSIEEIKRVILESVKSALKTKSRTVFGIEVSNTKVRIYAPVVVGRKGEYYQLLYDLLGRGYSSVQVDGKGFSLRERITLEKHKKHDIDVLVDEFSLSDFATSGGSENEHIRERLGEAIERALHESDGLIRVETPGASPEGMPERQLISAKFMCPYDGFSYPEIEPRLFSFNSPYGACPECNGLGTRYLFGDEPCGECKGARLREEALHVRLGGDMKQTRNKERETDAKRSEKNIVEVAAMSIAEAFEFFADLKLTSKEHEIGKVMLREIESRLEFMIDVGIEYLTLDRRAHTLSSGEAQRIRLASQLGSGLVGALYVLDEPTIGLHARDNARLIKTLLHLRDIGNTILVVEHDEETIRASDYLVDIGLGAGVHGGRIVAADYLKNLLAAKKSEYRSPTLEYLRGEKVILVPAERREKERGELKIRGGKIFNIKNLTVDIPLGRFVVITGVSGSGKSTFLYEILHRNLQARFERRFRSAQVFNCASFSGTEYLSRAILIDQSPIGRTPRSNPATYTGAWTFIRQLFAETEEARARGWGPSRFSFNVRGLPAPGTARQAGGRCEACQGNGELAVEMHFLPTVYVTCDVCRGKRFMKETLEVRYKKKNVHDILRMTIEEALAFFEDIPAVADRLKTLNEVGLGYLELGQSATTLSGGEAQRVKISSELYRTHVPARTYRFGTGGQKTIYLLDEPTVGLHYEDVRKLLEILQKLVNHGNTVVVIEHNMDVIKCADYLIDFGPEGGDGGGEIVAKGTPEEIARSEKSYTGEYLRKKLN